MAPKSRCRNILHTTRRLSSAVVLALACAGFADAATVVSPADSGPGTLREAILAANANPGPDTIEFALPSGELVITPLTPLPTLNGPTIIDGRSQTGWAGSPLVELDGQVAGDIGLGITAAEVTVRALAIHSFNRGIYVFSSGRLELLGCHIGTDATGTADLGNTDAGVYLTSIGNQIGGTATTDRNIISANGRGIAISATSQQNVVAGNYIGTDASGTTALGNTIGIRCFGSDNEIGTLSMRNLISGNGTGLSFEGDGTDNIAIHNWIGVDATGLLALPNTESGVYISGRENRIGGAAAGERNTISGNGTGILIGDAGTENRIEGNYIGTSIAGSTAVGNTIGVRVLGARNTVGGTQSGTRNIISANERGVYLDPEAEENQILGNLIGLGPDGQQELGNSEYGVRVAGRHNEIGSTAAGGANVISANGSGIVVTRETTSDNRIVGNLIGTDVAGLRKKGNDYAGIRVLDGARTQIGGGTAAETNVIAGGHFGIEVTGGATETTVYGNIIGLRADGERVLQIHESGIYLGSGGNRIGGPGGLGNVIAGSRLYGIVFRGVEASDNIVQGNQIGGVATDGTPLRNGNSGILIRNAFDNLIGGTAPGTGNRITQSGQFGIYVETGTGNEILGNEITESGLLALDHHEYGPTANDPQDIDAGPNLGQNHPVLSSALASATETTIDGVLDSTPNATFRIEFFANAGCHASGFGEAARYLGATTVVAGPSGRAPIHVALPSPVAEPFVTATATSLDGNTSELSPCLAVGTPQPGTLQFTQSTFVGYEYDGTVTVSVSRSHGVQGTISVDYETIDDVATAPDDYTAVSGTLTFAPGETLKTFDVPVAIDALDENGELFGLALSNPTDGANLGVQAVSEVWLGDADPTFPTVFFSDARLAEGNSGQTNAVFTIRVSPHSGPVTVGYETQDGTAIAGSDYVETTGQFVFAPDETTKQVAVPIIGDTTPESDELFFLMLALLDGGSVTDGRGEGVIEDDDTPVPTPLCESGTTFANPRIVIRGIGDPAQRLTLRGDLLFPAGAPAGYDPLDLAARGAQIRIEDLGSGTTALLDLTRDTSSIPAGAFDISGCDETMTQNVGWKTSNDLRRHTYVNRLGVFESAGCLAGSAEGLKRVIFRDRRPETGYIRFRMTARKPLPDTPVGPLRMTVVLGAGESASAEGACAVHDFQASDCELSAGGNRMTCSE